MISIKNTLSDTIKSSKPDWLIHTLANFADVKRGVAGLFHSLYKVVKQPTDSCVGLIKIVNAIT